MNKSFCPFPCVCVSCQNIVKERRIVSAADNLSYTQLCVFIHLHVCVCVCPCVSVLPSYSMNYWTSLIETKRMFDHKFHQIHCAVSRFNRHDLKLSAGKLVESQLKISVHYNPIYVFVCKFPAIFISVSDFPPCSMLFPLCVFRLSDSPGISKYLFALSNIFNYSNTDVSLPHTPMFGLTWCHFCKFTNTSLVFYSAALLVNHTL